MSVMRMENITAHSKELNDSFLLELELCKSDLIPSEFICPLTLNIMVDPVVIASNQTYERHYIERWFSEGHRTCPKTNQILPHTNTTSNLSLRVAIAIWCKENGILLSNKIWPEEKFKVINNVGNNGYSNQEEEKNEKDNLKMKKFPPFKKEISLSLPMKEDGQTDITESKPIHQNTLLTVEDISETQKLPLVKSSSAPNSPPSDQSNPSQILPNSQKSGNPTHVEKFTHSRSFKSHRLSQFKQMMISFSSDASSLPSPTSNPSSSNTNSDSQHVQNPIVQIHKPPNKLSLRSPANLNLPKIPIPPAQMQDFVGLQIQTKGPGMGSQSNFGGRKFMNVPSPRALDPSGRPLHDPSELTASVCVIDPSTEAEIRSVLDRIADGGSVESKPASEKMRSLSKISAATRLKIHEFGGIPKLISLLSSSDPSTVENAVTALLNLALEFKLKIEIVKAGALIPLSKILSDESQSHLTRENAAGALCSLSVAEENRHVICSEGIVPLLAEVLNRRKSSRGMKDACIGLFNLAIAPAGKKLVIETGIVSSLLRLLSEDLPIEEEVMALLANLSKAEEVCERIEDEGGISVLNGVLESGSLRSKASVVSILLLMTGKESARNSMWEEGVIPCLATLSQGVINDRAKEKVLELLKVLRS